MSSGFYSNWSFPSWYDTGFCRHYQSVAKPEFPLDENDKEVTTCNATPVIFQSPFVTKRGKAGFRQYFGVFLLIDCLYFNEGLPGGGPLIGIKYVASVFPAKRDKSFYDN